MTQTVSLFSHAEPAPEPDPDAPGEQRIVATVGVHGGGLAGVLADGSLGDVMLGSLGQDDTYETEVLLDPAADTELRHLVAALARHAADTAGPDTTTSGRVTTTARLVRAADGAGVLVLLGRLAVGALDAAAAATWTEVLTDLEARGARHVFAATQIAWDRDDAGAPGGAEDTGPAAGVPLHVRLDLVAEDEYADDVLVDAREILDDPLSELGRS